MVRHFSPIEIRARILAELELKFKKYCMYKLVIKRICFQYKEDGVDLMDIRSTSKLYWRTSDLLQTCKLNVII